MLKILRAKPRMIHKFDQDVESEGFSPKLN